MRKGERFEEEVAKWISASGYVIYRRPKVMFRSQDMFGGDVLWVIDGVVVVIQCKKGADIRLAGRRGRASVRKNGRLSVGRVKNFIAVCAGRSHREVLIQYEGEAEWCGLMLGILLSAQGVKCLFEKVENKEARYGRAS